MFITHSLNLATQKFRQLLICQYEQPINSLTNLLDIIKPLFFFRVTYQKALLNTYVCSLLNMKSIH